MTTDSDTDFLSIERIAQSILVLRERRVLLDSDLATMYGVTTKRFNEQVKRNLARFPADFAFQLSDEEAESLRSQFATLKKSRRGQHRKYLPYAFTEHGAIMAAMVLNSARAVEMSVYVVRAFVQLRSVLASDADLGRRVTNFEITNCDLKSRSVSHRYRYGSLMLQTATSNATSTSMARFIHLFDENDAARIKRDGIRIAKVKMRKLNGVFLFPLTENFVVSHQWMRELRRRRGQTILAARIRVDDTEPVLLGKYNEPHAQVQAAEAIGILREHTDPMGLQVILPRSVKPNEIESIYRPPKIVGWRYYPAARGRRPCGCPFCQKGEPFARRIRDAYEREA